MSYRVHVRTNSDPRPMLATIREQVHSLDPNLPIVGSNLMKNLSGRAILPYTITSTVLSAAGLIALGLAMMGIYGVMAYTVSQRTREVGVRIAIGARGQSVVAMIVREGMMLAAVGAACALPLILLLTQLLKSFVVGVRPLDPVSLVGGIALLAFSALAATAFPARQASRVDPMMALRSE